MKNFMKIPATVAIGLCVAQATFAQSSKQDFSQKAGPQGTMMGKAMRSCFGGNNAKAKVVAVINHADWCQVCQKNSDRVETLLSEYKSKPIALVPNDITDYHSKAVSAKYLRKVHTYEAVQPVKESGVIILVSGKTHQVISKISLASSNEDIEKAFDSALNN